MQQRRDPRVVQGTHHVVNYTLSTAEISFMTACRAAGDDPLKTASGTFIALIVLLAFQTFAAADAAKRVDIITMVDTPQLLEVLDGIRQGLHDHGYVDGADIKIDFKSAQGNFGTAQQIVRQYIGDQPDVIVTITTPTSQAAVAATKDIPIIFTTVVVGMELSADDFRRRGARQPGTIVAASLEQFFLRPGILVRCLDLRPITRGA